MSSPVSAAWITELILQDMRHHRFLLGLERIGLTADDHFLDIRSVVAALMGLDARRLHESWTDTYMGYLQLAAGYESDGSGENLRSLASLCYAQMQRITEGIGR